MGKANAVFLVVAIILQAWLVGLLVFRKVHREFQLFFAYASYGLVVSVARLLVSGNYRAYFFVFWFTDAGFALLAIAALWEAFHSVFKAFHLLWWFRLLFPAVILLVSAISAIHAFIHPPIHIHPLIRLILDIDIGVHYVQAGIFGLFFFLARLLRLQWRHWAFGIVLGFAVSAIGTEIATLVRYEFGARLEILSRIGPAIVYLAALAVWLVTFHRPREPQLTDEWANTITPAQVLGEIREYTVILQSFFGKRRR